MFRKVPGEFPKQIWENFEQKLVLNLSGFFGPVLDLGKQNLFKKNMSMLTLHRSIK